ncbi:hypothetical protein AB0424_28420 [Streptomyces sp. NPDC051180]|uniref:hypothetical protein n=1 Tax=unclassified Streptomyces TaxID=2593676 RepID=UPI00344E7CC8
MTKNIAAALQAAYWGVALAWAAVYPWLEENLGPYYSHEVPWFIALTLAPLLGAPAWVALLGIVPIAWNNRKNRRQR